MQTSKASRLGSSVNEESIELASLSDLTGFPVDYIKSELVLNDDKISLSELRKTMVSYLESVQNDD